MSGPVAIQLELKTECIYISPWTRVTAPMFKRMLIAHCYPEFSNRRLAYDLDDKLVPNTTYRRRSFDIIQPTVGKQQDACCLKDRSLFTPRTVLLYVRRNQVTNATHDVNAR